FVHGLTVSAANQQNVKISGCSFENNFNDIVIRCGFNVKISENHFRKSLPPLPDWAANQVVGAGYTIQPTNNNSGRFTFRCTNAMAPTALTEPMWPQGGGMVVTVTDGGVTWLRQPLYTAFPSSQSIITACDPDWQASTAYVAAGGHPSSGSVI